MLKLTHTNIKKNGEIMKDFFKFSPNALVVGVLAGSMQLLDMSLNSFVGWAGFAAWACFFFAGADTKGAIKVMSCWIAGVIAAIAIIELGGALTDLIGNDKIGFTLAVGLLAYVVFLFERVPALDLIPAWFVGAACYFALFGKMGFTSHEKASIAILLSCLIAQGFGFATVALHGLAAKKVAASKK